MINCNIGKNLFCIIKSLATNFRYLHEFAQFMKLFFIFVQLKSAIVFLWICLRYKLDQVKRSESKLL